MVSMLNMNLNQLAGLWLSDDCTISMWIGIETNRIEICIQREVLISESLDFLYDKNRNICRLSGSVLLYQLFTDNEILIRVSLNECVRDYMLKKRGK